MKLMIVGVQGIGKTSLLEQLRLEGTVTKKNQHEVQSKGHFLHSFVIAFMAEGLDETESIIVFRVGRNEWETKISIRKRQKERTFPLLAWTLEIGLMNRKRAKPSWSMALLPSERGISGVR